MFKNDLSERAAYRSMFTFRQSLEEMDAAAVNGLDKAIENADALVAEIIDSLRGMRKAA
jgi:chromosome partitioning protein